MKIQNGAHSPFASGTRYSPPRPHTGATPSPAAPSHPGTSSDSGEISPFPPGELASDAFFPHRLSGSKWTDLLHVCGVAAAGYVPQLFSTVFTADMVKALLAMSGARAVVFDAAAFPDAPRESGLPAWPAPGADALREVVARHEGALWMEEGELVAVGERDPCAIFHSSGTTAGLPKLIPTSHLLMKGFIEEKFPDCLISSEYDASSYVYNRYMHSNFICSLNLTSCDVASAV